MGRTMPIDGAEGIRPFLNLHKPGESDAWTDGFSARDGRILGTYLHGLLDSPRWRLNFLNRLRRSKKLSEKKRAAPSRGKRFHHYDLLADHYERHVDVEAIMKVMGW
jgi:adenosylcobyric acid synthase